MVGQVVDRHQGGRSPDDRVVGIEAVPQEDRRTGMPVVEMEDVDRSTVGPEGLQGRSTEQPEAPRVVRVVDAARLAVVTRPIEGRRVIDQAKPVAVAEDIDDGDLGISCRGQWIGHPDTPTGMLAVGQGHRPVARQEDVDRCIGAVRDAAEGASQGIDHVAEAARLGPRLALGGDERDTHLDHGSGRRPAPGGAVGETSSRGHPRRSVRRPV